ncbi:rubrerythrin family protein [Clostridium carnis]
MKSLKGTETGANLLRAFAGESQARNRYVFYSQVADQEGYRQIADIFRLTAENEQGHGEIFFNFLVKDYNNEELEITANYPLAKGNTLANLKAAAHDEENEEANVYPSFAEIARNEGFPEIATAFTLVAKIENHHKERFETLLKNVEQNKVFSKDIKESWICRFCGYIYEGTEAPQKCPFCQHPQSYYEILSEKF